MSRKEKLIKKLCDPNQSKNFTIEDMESLMSKCGCVREEGGRGSGIRYVKSETQQVVSFDAPHPQKELYRYHKSKLIEFLKLIGEIK